MFLLFSNFLGFFPKSVNGNLNVINPIYFSFCVYFTFNLIGLGVLATNLLVVFYPSSIVTYLISPILLSIETIAYFIRPISLSLRLFANTVSGHLLLHMIAGYFLVFLKFNSIFLCIVSFVFILIISLIESFVSVIQPIIFITLLGFFISEIFLKN